MIRSYNTQHPAHWDEQQSLCYALIYTSLETLMKPVDIKLKEYVTKEGLHKFHETGYSQSAMEYADAYHFVMSRFFEVGCEMCGIDGDAMLKKVSPHIDFQHVRNGDAALALEEKRAVTLQLEHGDVAIEIPQRWSMEDDEKKETRTA